MLTYINIELGGAAVAWPLAARAQQAQMTRIGLLHGSLPSQFTDVAFRQGLREVGFIEGQNVIIESRWAGGNYQRLPALAAQLVEQHKPPCGVWHPRCSDR